MIKRVHILCTTYCSLASMAVPQRLNISGVGVQYALENSNQFHHIIGVAKIVIGLLALNDLASERSIDSCNL